jgi:phosphotriesterase-related protein
VDAVAALQQAHAEGVRSYIDPTTFDIGRDIALMQEVSSKSGVHIVPTTGSHQAIPRVFRTASPDAIAAVYIREIESVSTAPMSRRVSSNQPATGEV